MGPLSSFRIGVTATRKAHEQIEALTRRGAEVVWAPVLAESTAAIDTEALRLTTESVIADPPDLLVATTGVGITTWFEAAQQWGLDAALQAALTRAQILSRGPKSTAALRRHNLTVLWSPESETLDELLTHLRTWDLDGRRIVLQEHGQSLTVAAQGLRRLGAIVDLVSTYRVSITDDAEPVFALIDEVADRLVDAVTFTSAPAVTAFMDVAAASGRRAEVISALREDVVAVSVGEVTASAASAYGIPTIAPDRARLGAMLRLIETAVPQRRDGLRVELIGHVLTWLEDSALLDGEPLALSPAPLAVLGALVEKPGQVVSRQALLQVLPQASSEHAVDMAVARLRAAMGPELVQTVVKRGYRLAVPR